MSRPIIPYRSMKKILFVIPVALLSLLISGCGYNNVETPAGYVGYVTQGAVFGETHYVGLQSGPISSGLHWMYRVHNVSVTPYTYDEVFSAENNTGVLAKDQLAVSFAVHVTFKVRPDRVKDFIDKYTTLTESQNADQIVETAYRNYVKEPVRSMARAQVEQFEGLAVQEHIGEITTKLKALVSDSLASTPFEVLNVVVGNVQYPRVVTEAIAQKIAALQENQRQETILRTIMVQANQKREEAKGIADAMTTISEKLTPEYIQYEAIKAQMAMVNSPNHTTIYIPVGPMGVPVVKMTDTTADAAPTSPVKAAK